MRNLFTSWVVMSIVCGAFGSPQAGLVKGSREYVKKERQLHEAKKEQAKEEQELSDFERMIEELEAMPPVRVQSADFWSLNAVIRGAMERELAQATGRRDGEAGASVDKMVRTIHESDGLQYWVADGDGDARARYHHLLGTFRDLMRADLETRANSIRDEENALLGRAE